MKSVYLAGLLASVLVLTLLGAGGCTVVGVMIHSVAGDPPVPALYKPKKVPTLVLVENHLDPGEVQLDADQIAHQICQELKENAGLTVIDPDQLTMQRDQDPKAYHKMSIAALGKSVNAKQVIYVDLRVSEVTPDATQSVVNARALARVRVVDVDTGDMLWPAAPPGGWELERKVDFDSGDISRAQSMHTELLTDLSSQISKLFYDWKADDHEQETAGG